MLGVQLIENGIQEVVLELDESFEKADNLVLARLAKAVPDRRMFSYRHEIPLVEPMLWAADIAAWAVANGDIKPD